MRWEPIHEVTQIKGDGEAHPLLSPNDEFADFETWDNGSFGPQPKAPDMLPREYAREALKRGLAYEARLGANPFRFGMPGSTDSHTALSTAGEDNFFGKVWALEPSADPIRFDYADTDLDRSDFARYGYANGVPMGGDLEAAGESQAPTFLVRAVRDPDGANLDRVQIIKGWLDADGKTQERIYDIAVSDGRQVHPPMRERWAILPEQRRAPPSCSHRRSKTAQWWYARPSSFVTSMQSTM